VRIPLAASPKSWMPTSRFGTRLVGRARSMKSRSVADWRRSRPTGGLNFPARTLANGEKRASRYASCRTV
jgi:hypothetical protein